MPDSDRERKKYMKNYYSKRNALSYHLINYAEDLENINVNK